MSIGDPPVSKADLDTHLAQAAANLRQIFTDPGTPQAAVARFLSNHDQAALITLGYTSDEAYEAGLFGNVLTALTAYFTSGTAVAAAATTPAQICRDLAPLR